MKIYGPVEDGDSVIVDDRKCPICRKRFAVGDQYVLVSIGPDPKDFDAVRKYLTKSGVYNAVARCVHDTCLLDVDPEFYV